MKCSRCQYEDRMQRSVSRYAAEFRRTGGVPVQIRVASRSRPRSRGGAFAIHDPDGVGVELQLKKRAAA